MRLAHAAPPGSKYAPLTLTKRSDNAPGHEPPPPADLMAQRVARASSANAYRRGDDVDTYMDPDARPGRPPQDAHVAYEPNYGNQGIGGYGAHSRGDYDGYGGGTSAARHLPTSLQLRALLLKRLLCSWRDKDAFLMQVRPHPSR